MGTWGSSKNLDVFLNKLGDNTNAYLLEIKVEVFSVAVCSWQSHFLTVGDASYQFQLQVLEINFDSI